MRNLIRITAVAAALLMPIGGFAAQRTGGEGAGGRLTQMCDAGSRDIAGLPVEQFQRTVQADDAQRAALDDLGNATLKAAQDIKAACPTEAVLTVPGRLAAMQTRIEAMIAAVATVRPPLEKFYGLLSDEQKEQIIALGQNQRQSRTGSVLDQNCGSAQTSVTGWPTADIARTVRPTEAQRASLTALQDTAAKAADMFKGSCTADNLLTPTARLAAVGKRLDTLLQAVKTVSGPLNDFYATLDDEQKARFNAISLPQTSQIEQPSAKPTIVHGHHFVSIRYVIRRLLRSF
jgi:LTXXQ motif family protein